MGIDDKDQQVLERILYAKNNLNISDAEICEELNIQRNSVSEWKSGKSKTFLKHIPNLANMFDLPIEYFFGQVEVVFSVNGVKRVIKNELPQSGQPVFYDALGNQVHFTDAEIELEKLRVNQALTQRIEEISRKVSREVFLEEAKKLRQD